MHKWNDILEAFIIKRKSFEYENEIRGITCLSDRELDGKRVLNAVCKEKVPSLKSRVVNPREMTDKGKSMSVLIFKH
jgi:hypothetical protein